MHRRTLGAIALAVPALALASGCATASHATDTNQSDQAASPNEGFVPISEAEFNLLKKSVLFTEDDARYLRMSRAVLEPNVDELLNVWYGFVGSNDHLVYYFSHPTTKEPDARYLTRVRARFGQWVLDTADANFDQAWLNKQLELGLRHHRLKKNTTDNANAVDHIPFRYLVALHYPITTTMKPFLAQGGHSEEDVQGMYEAWRKAVLMTAILWSQPYINEADF